MASSPATSHGFALTRADQPRYSGIATLLRADYQPTVDDLDIALVGVPSDFPSFLAGTRYGPAQIREAGRITRPVHYATKLQPFELARVADVGDAPVDFLDQARQNALLEEYYGQIIDRGVTPLSVGGDHGVTLPILRAVGRRYRGIGLLQIDAHSDTFDEYLGTKDNHATVVRRAIEEGILDPRRIVTVGLRNTLHAPDQLDWAIEQGVTIISADEFFEIGAERAAQLAAEQLGDGPRYVTLDIDGLDPSYAPGTGVRDPGGLSYRDYCTLLRSQWGTEVIGGDVVEVSPPLDPSGITATLASNLAFELLCLLAQTVSAQRA
jgi:guanidinopropionase